VNKPGSDKWLEDHGISREVWDARRYVRYGPDVEGDPLDPVREEYKGLLRSHRTFASMVAKGGRNPYRKEHPEVTNGGFLIKRHNPVGPT
jgi:hypothetical protein